MWSCLTIGGKKKKDEESTNEDRNPAGTRNPPVTSNQNAGASVSTDGTRGKAVIYSYRNLVKLTNDFNYHRKFITGETTAGPVYHYRGIDEATGRIVSVKRIDDQTVNDFTREVQMLCLLRHPHIVNLFGYGTSEGDRRFLVYDFMPVGSLAKHLHDREAPMQALDWKTRMRIASDIASAVHYLHTEVRPPVIFVNLTADHILLDQGFHPRLEDFTRAKFCLMGDNGHVSSDAILTPGYASKDVRITTKSDVHGFGAILVALITGLRPGELISEADTLYDLVRQGKFKVDPVLGEQCDKRSLQSAAELAEACLNPYDPVRRPTMQEVLRRVEDIRSVMRFEEERQRAQAQAASTSRGKGKVKVTRT